MCHWKRRPQIKIPSDRALSMNVVLHSTMNTMFIVLRCTTFICTLTFSVQPRSSVGWVMVDLFQRSWVRFPPRSKGFFFTLYGSLIRVFIRSRQPANSGGYFRYQRHLLLLTFAIRTLKVYFFIWRLLTLHWSYKNKGTRKWKFLTLILGLIFCCGWF